MPLKSYRDLIAWQKSMDLVQTVYESVRAFPKEEIYGLTSQLKRAVVSVPSNVAEGQGRKSSREFLHHLSIAYGSLMEVETQILIAARLGYLSSDEANRITEQTAEVGRVLNGLSNALNNKQVEAVRR